MLQGLHGTGLKASGTWRSCSARQLGSRQAELKAGPPAACGLSGRPESQCWEIKGSEVDNIQRQTGGEGRRQLGWQAAALGAFFSFLPRKAALPGDLFLASRDVQMGTINKGTLPFLSPSQNAPPLRLSVLGLGLTGECVAGRRSMGFQMGLLGSFESWSLPTLKF